MSLSKIYDFLFQEDGFLFQEDDSLPQGSILGFCVLIIGGSLLAFMLILGQAMSLIHYDFVVSMGLQEPKEIVSEMGVAVNKGFALSDTVIYLPLLLAGLIGLCFKKTWGLLAMSGALAITAYWPIAALSILFFAKGSPGFCFSNYISYTILLITVSLYGIWGLWYLYKNAL